jgi:hypothetical protein
MCSLVWVTDTFVESKSLPRTDLGLKEKRSERWPSFREQGRRPEREEEEKTNSVAHDRELVQTRLSIEEHDAAKPRAQSRPNQLSSFTNSSPTLHQRKPDSLSISQMPLDDIPNFQPISNRISIRCDEVPFELSRLRRSLLHKVRSRPLPCSRPDELSELLDVIPGDALRVGELDGDLFGNGELVESKGTIWRGRASQSP